MMVITDTPTVVRALSSNFYDGEPNLCCPTCWRDESHIREVFTQPGSNPGERGAAYPGTELRGPVMKHQRCDALVIVLDGECGHQWQLRIQQYKGINKLELAPQPAGPTLVARDDE
jgi:hypothetical protein